MFVIDPETGATVDETPTPADAAVEPPTPAPEPDADPIAAALDKGVEEATPTAPEPEVPAEPEVPVTPEQPPPEAPQPDAEAEAEIAALGLKERSAARFRELTGEIKELAPLRDALKTAGIEDVAELPKLVERAKVADDLVGMVMETGASSEQYGMTLDYLALANKASKGDRKAAEQAFAMMQSEMQVWARMLGKDLPGIHDPLAEHADLQAAVAAGDLTKEYAAELAAQRGQAVVQQHTQAQHQQQAAAQHAQEQGLRQLVAFDQQMTADPAYQAKRPMLNAMVANIRATLPPAQWLVATQQAYASIPDVPTPAPAPRPAPAAPARPSAPQSLTPTTFASVDDALAFGIKQASAA